MILKKHLEVVEELVNGVIGGKLVFTTKTGSEEIIEKVAEGSFLYWNLDSGPDQKTPYNLSKLYEFFYSTNSEVRYMSKGKVIQGGEIKRDEPLWLVKNVPIDSKIVFDYVSPYTNGEEREFTVIFTKYDCDSWDDETFETGTYSDEGIIREITDLQTTPSLKNIEVRLVRPDGSEERLV